MASTFTLNFCLSGILGYGWGSFNQPGLLNFGVFSVSRFSIKTLYTAPFFSLLQSSFEEKFYRIYMGRFVLQYINKVLIFVVEPVNYV